MNIFRENVKDGNYTAESIGASHGGKLGLGSPVASAEIRYLHSRQEFFEKTNPRPKDHDLSEDQPHVHVHLLQQTSNIISNSFMDFRLKYPFCLCFFFVPLENFSHMETSPLPVKGFKF